MTTTPLTGQQLDEIEQRAGAATKGPWGLYDGDNYADVAADLTMTGRGSYSYREKIARLEDETYWDDSAHEGDDEDCAPEQMAANAAFIANARTDVPALLAEVRRLRVQAAELEGPAVEDAVGSTVRAQLADAVIAWSGQTIGCHVPTVDAIVELINPQSEPRVCGDQFIDRTCSLRDGHHLDGKHRDEFKGTWWDQSSVPPYSNRDRVAEAELGVQG